jgi:dienelactone hydrolase
MRTACWRERLFALALLLLSGASLPARSSATGVEPLFDLRSPNTAPFPSNRFTVFELRNLTGLRVNLPRPDCTTHRSDCDDLAVLNSLDGFNLQPRLRIPFSGAIDPSSVDSSNVFLVRLGDTTRLERNRRAVVGINQVVWDAATNTLFAESEQLLDQHTAYALIVTNGIRDSGGRPVRGGKFAGFLTDFRFDLGLLAYRASLLTAIAAAGIPPRRIVAASVFTTLSVTSDLEKIRDQIKRRHAAPASFTLTSDGSRTVFPLSAVRSAVLSQQVSTTPTFQTTPIPLAVLNTIVPSSVASVAFGRITSPDYTTQQFIPPIHTRTGVPVVQRSNEIFFNLMLPSGTKPANGWPVAIFGHGFGGNKESVIAVASVLAARGIATLALNVVGHGGGALSTLSITRTDGTIATFPSGGRGIDQNGDGMIGGTEGVDAVPGRTIISNRDGLRQTVVDLMQMVRVIETGGVDLEGDGTADLDRERIYYFGISFGGIYGTILLGVEPSIRAGVPNVMGGPIVELSRLGAFRPLVGAGLGARIPSLLNAPPTPPLFGFNENFPLRNQPTLVNTVPGAIAIQDFFDRSEWASLLGNCVAFAPHIRKDPVRGAAPKPVIMQLAKGDMTVPNPANSAVIRAGELTDRTTYFRNDLAVAANPAVSRNPHSFLANILGAGAPFALAAQQQIAEFFASDGARVIDPDGAAPIFETPIAGPLPEELNFLP